MSLARRNLLQDRTRLALSVSGVALAVMLMLLLNGLLGGMYTQIGAYLDHSPGSLVVAQRGVRNLLGATSLLPPSMDGIPIVSQFIILDLHGCKQPTYMIGNDSSHGSDPWQLVSGRNAKTDNARGCLARFWPNGITSRWGMNCPSWSASSQWLAS